MGAEKDWYQPNASKTHQSFFEMPTHQTDEERKAQDKEIAKGADDGE